MYDTHTRRFLFSLEFTYDLGYLIFFSSRCFYATIPNVLVHDLHDHFMTSLPSRFV